ncbi:MAG: hypothetical protein GWN79_06525 [Actinobacteria bacterium]|nr:hypothetical protein [Actinomycetota bacterium]NIS30483.1 hypothetical protein [Actinomycetota bacterium]NIT95084.1 hypothetical protein [Actinomycetota bacterium]NIU18761.1 hypothetical protein [Actinomycetota bacterium]NIU65706.1 hypothetical protein [Actinomycetota bacterium]
MISEPHSDVLRFDRLGALRLCMTLRGVAADVRRDRNAVLRLMDQASDLLGADQRGPAGRLRVAEYRLDELAADLRHRLALVDSMWERVSAIDELADRVTGWPGSDNDPELDRLVRQWRRQVEAFLGRGARGDPTLAAAVLAEMAGGRSLIGAIGQVQRARFEARVDDVVAGLGLDRAAAEAHVREIDRQLGIAVGRGVRADDALAAVAVAMALDLDIEEAADIAADLHGRRATLVDALGWMAGARALGVTVPELLALEGLVAHFDTFDSARHPHEWMGRDLRVGLRDLGHVVDHPDRYTEGQVRAAGALLAHPELLARLDTAAEVELDIGEPRFGATRRHDGVVSYDDLQSFMVKARVAVALAPYADVIDVAADPGGVIDGFHSRADLERFLAETPDLPGEVVVAARAVIDHGLFDRTWLESHRDELAMGAAALAGGLVVVVSAGAATPLVVSLAGAAAGATAAGGTTLLVNASGDADDLDDGLGANLRSGAMVGFSVAGFPAALSGIGAASGPTAGTQQLVAGARATSAASGVVANGGVDLLLPEEFEDELHEFATALGITADGFLVAHRALADPPPWLLDQAAVPLGHSVTSSGRAESRAEGPGREWLAG